MNQGLEWVRKIYKVPAKRGQRVTYISENKPDKAGRITSGKSGYIYIWFDGDKCTHPAPFHPTWNIVYHL